MSLSAPEPGCCERRTAPVPAGTANRSDRAGRQWARCAQRSRATGRAWRRLAVLGVLMRLRLPARAWCARLRFALRLSVRAQALSGRLGLWAPPAVHGKSVKKGRRRPDARAYRDDLFRKSQPPLYAPLRSPWEASHMARWTDLFPACYHKRIRALRTRAPAGSASYSR